MEREAVLAVLGANLRRIREQREVSQEWVAVRACLRVTSVSAFERGAAKPTLFDLLALADALQASLGELVEGVPVPRREGSTEAILEAARQGRRISVDQVARELEVNRSAAHLLSRRLCAEGLLEHDPRGYRAPSSRQDGVAG